MSKPMPQPLRRVCQTLVRDSLQSLSDSRLLQQFAAGNEMAFTALVERHGPLVRGICQRTLRDSNLGDDAFQATFLVLARKSKSVRRPEALGGWLFGVARRIAGKLLLRQERQRRREQAAAQRRPEAQESRPWDDLLQILDEEILRLPERLRAPIVACYLQGRTQEEAARELGWPLITLRRRLAQGRELLRLRLEPRGVAFSAGLTAAVLVPAADAAVPAALSEITAIHAMAALRGEALPTGLVELVRGGGSLRAMRMMFMLLIVACVLVGVGTLRPWPQKPQAVMLPEPPPAKPKEVLRDHFNDPLPEGAVARLGTISLRHGAGLHKLAFMPDGKTLVSLGDFVRMWDVATGHESGQFGEMGSNGESVRSAAMTPDGKSIVLARGTNQRVTVSIWDATAREQRRSFQTPKRPFGEFPSSEKFLLSSDGRFMAELDSSNKLYLWDVFAGVVKFEFGPFDKRIDEKLAFTADGGVLVVADWERKVRAFDTATGKKQSEFGDGSGRVPHIALGPTANFWPPRFAKATLGMIRTTSSPFGMWPKARRFISCGPRQAYFDSRLRPTGNRCSHSITVQAAARTCDGTWPRENRRAIGWPTRCFPGCFPVSASRSAPMQRRSPRGK
jgi:RNA polymerase sigma factor (sigma-70 family)